MPAVQMSHLGDGSSSPGLALRWLQPSQCIECNLVEDPRPDCPAKPLPKPDSPKLWGNKCLFIYFSKVKEYLPTLSYWDPGYKSLAGSKAQRSRAGTSQTDCIQISVLSSTMRYYTNYLTWALVSLPCKTGAVRTHCSGNTCNELNSTW